MRPKLAVALCSSALVALLGCSDHVAQPTAPPVATVHTYDPIQTFINSQPIPSPQPVHVLLSVARGAHPIGGAGATFFVILYGAIHHDLAGDYYDYAWGVRYGRKAGWLAFESLDPGIDPARLTMYSPAPEDAILYSQDTWNALKSLPWPDRAVFWNALMPMLAMGTAVPESALVAVVAELKLQISVPFAWMMFDNPTVVHSRAALTALATLPAFPWGDPYADVRAYARALLNALP